MNRKKTAARWLCLILAAVFLTGCSYTQELFKDWKLPVEDRAVESSQSGEESGAKRDSADASPWKKGDELRPGTMDFDDFLESLFLDSATSNTLNLHFYFADPEGYGITPGPVTFGEFGYEDKELSAQSIEECRRYLERYSREDMDQDQRISADLLDAYLDISERDLEFDYYFEPFKPGMGVHVSLPYSLAEYVFYDEQDVEDYLELLSLFEEYFGKVLEWEGKKAAEGLFMTDERLDTVLEECRAYLWDGQEEFFLNETFYERLEEVPGLTEEEKDAYRKEEEQILKTDFTSAYGLLIDGLEGLRGSGVNDKGVCYFPKGQEYYVYLIDSNIGMTYDTVDELYQAVGEEIIGIYNQVYAIYEEDESLWEQEEYVEREDDRSPEEMLEDLRERIGEDFPEAPDSSYQVKKVPKSMEEYMNPAFYMIPPVDRYNENVIYINEGQMKEGTDGLYTTLAHEGYPGHLYQSVYFGSKGCNFRKMLDFTGYSEGWGTYAEYYSCRWLDGMTDAQKDLYCLSERLNLAISALLDIGINYYGWTREETEQMCENLTGASSEKIVENVYPYIISDPGGYLDYYVGYMEIVKMADTARETLGAGFDIREFHRFLLDFGPAPFTVIQPYFQEWMDGFEGTKIPIFDEDPKVARLRGQNMLKRNSAAFR